MPQPVSPAQIAKHAQLMEEYTQLFVAAWQARSAAQGETWDAAGAEAMRQQVMANSAATFATLTGGWTGTGSQEITKVIDAIKGLRPRRPAPAAAAPAAPASATAAFATVDIPTGRYLVDGRVYLLEQGKRNHAGRTFLRDVTGLADKWEAPRLEGADFRRVVALIGQDPVAACIAYARQTGNCGICNIELTVPESIERGIGPKCWKKLHQHA